MSDNPKEWNGRERTSWWVRYAVVIAAATGVITLTNMCGGRALGLVTVSEAKVSHDEIKTEIEKTEKRLNKRIDDTLVRIENQIKDINTKIDNKSKKKR